MTVIDIPLIEVVETETVPEENVIHALCGREYPPENCPYPVYIGVCGDDALWIEKGKVCEECDRIYKAVLAGLMLCPRCGEAC